MTMCRKPAWKRDGFTLLELMMVITIIGFLAAMAAAVVTNLVTTAREEATAATILKIHEMLNQRIVAFEKTLKGSYLEKLVEQELERLEQVPSPGIYGVRPKVAEILVRKRLFKTNFPQRYSETDRIAAEPASDPVTESAELLYFILAEAEVFGVSPVDSEAFTTSEVTDTDNDGRLEFVDAWGKPLRFYRWPTRLINPDADIATSPARLVADLLIKGLPAEPAAGQGDALNRDSDDLLSLLQSETDRIANFADEFNEDNYHTIDTYHVPLIVSAGPDGQPGLYEPYESADPNKRGTLAMPISTTDLDALTDNITNRNRRAGGN